MYNPSVSSQLSPNWDNLTPPLSPSRTSTPKKHLALSLLPPNAFHALSEIELYARDKVNRSFRLVCPKSPSLPQVGICLEHFLKDLRQRLVDAYCVRYSGIDFYYCGGQGTQLACGESLYPDTQDLDIFIFVHPNGSDLLPVIAAWTDALLLEFLHDPRHSREELLENYRTILYFSNRGCRGMAYQLAGIDLTFFEAKSNGGFSDCPYHATANSFLIPLFGTWGLSLSGDYDKAVADVHNGYVDLPLVSYLGGKGLFSPWRYLTWGWRPLGTAQQEELFKKLAMQTSHSPHYLEHYLKEHYAGRPLGALLFLLNAHFDFCNSNTLLTSFYLQWSQVLSRSANHAPNISSFFASYAQRLLQAKDHGIFLASWVAFLLQNYPDAAMHPAPPPRIPLTEGMATVSRWEQEGQFFLAVGVADPSSPCQYYLMVPTALRLSLSDCHRAYYEEQGTPLKGMSAQARLFACLCRPISAKEKQLASQLQQGELSASKIWQFFLLALSGTDEGADLGLFATLQPQQSSLSLLWARQAILALIHEALPLAKQMPTSIATFQLQARLLWLQYAATKKPPLKESFGLIGRVFMALPLQDRMPLVTSLLPLLQMSKTPLKVGKLHEKHDAAEWLEKWCYDSVALAGATATLQHFTWALEHANEIAGPLVSSLLARISAIPALCDISLFLWEHSPKNDATTFLNLAPYLLENQDTLEELSALFSLGEQLLLHEAFKDSIQAHDFFYALLKKIAKQTSPLLQHLPLAFSQHVSFGSRILLRLSVDDLPEESLTFIHHAYHALCTSSLEALYATLALPLDSKLSQALHPQALALLSAVHYPPSYVSQKHHTQEATLLFLWIEELAKVPETLSLAYDLAKAMQKNGLMAHLSPSHSLSSLFALSLQRLHSFSAEELDIAYFVLTSASRNLGALILKTLPYIFSLGLQEDRKDGWIQLVLTTSSKLSIPDQTSLWHLLFHHLDRMTDSQRIFVIESFYKSATFKTPPALLQEAFCHFLRSYPQKDSLTTVYSLAVKKKVFSAMSSIDPALLITTAQRLTLEEGALLLAAQLLSHITAPDQLDPPLQRHLDDVLQQWAECVIKCAPWEHPPLVTALQTTLTRLPVPTQLAAFEGLMTYHLGRKGNQLQAASDCLLYFVPHAHLIARFAEFHSKLLRRFHQNPSSINDYWNFFSDVRLSTWISSHLGYLLDFPEHLAEQPLFFRAFLDFLKTHESAFSNKNSPLGDAYCHLILHTADSKNLLPFLETLYQLAQLPVIEGTPSTALIAIPPKIFEKTFSALYRISASLLSDRISDSDLAAYNFLLFHLACLWHDKSIVSFSSTQKFSLRQQAIDACALLLIHFYTLLDLKAPDFPFTAQEVCSFTQQKLGACKNASHPIALSHAIMTWAGFLPDRTDHKWLDMGTLILRKLLPFYEVFPETPAFVQSAYLALYATKARRQSPTLPLNLQDACLEEMWKRLSLSPLSAWNEIVDLLQFLVDHLHVVHPADKAARICGTLLIHLSLRPISDVPVVAKVCSSLSCLPVDYLEQQEGALVNLLILWQSASKEHQAMAMPDTWNSLSNLTRLLKGSFVSEKLGVLLPSFFETALEYATRENKKQLAVGFLHSALRPWTVENVASHPIGWRLFDLLLQEKEDLAECSIFAKDLITEMYITALIKKSLTDEDSARFENGLLNYASTFFHLRDVPRNVTYDLLSFIWESNLLSNDPKQLLLMDKMWLEGATDHQDIDLVAQYSRFYQEALWNLSKNEIANMRTFRYRQLAKAYPDLAEEIGKMLLKAICSHTLDDKGLFDSWKNTFARKNSLLMHNNH